MRENREKSPKKSGKYRGDICRFYHDFCRFLVIFADFFKYTVIFFFFVFFNIFEFFILPIYCRCLPTFSPINPIISFWTLGDIFADTIFVTLVLPSYYDPLVDLWSFIFYLVLTSLLCVLWYDNFYFMVFNFYFWTIGTLS